ncbi:hypothetical protein BDV59DRAFT_107757 [Aspergillus ambiguus]|uniref:uncharacterized protein n=1 Tax=Aspergillus ambiguus TaxID=176160 RepID=UPI003CCE442C
MRNILYSTSKTRCNPPPPTSIPHRRSFAQTSKLHAAEACVEPSGPRGRILGCAIRIAYASDRKRQRETKLNQLAQRRYKLFDVRSTPSAETQTLSSLTPDHHRPSSRRSIVPTVVRGRLRKSPSFIAGEKASFALIPPPPLLHPLLASLRYLVCPLVNFPVRSLHHGCH